MKRLTSIATTILFLAGLLLLGLSITPWFPNEIGRLSSITSFSSGFYVDWGVFWGIGAAVGVGGLIVLWARDNVEF